VGRQGVQKQREEKPAPKEEVAGVDADPLKGGEKKIIGGGNNRYRGKEHVFLFLLQKEGKPLQERGGNAACPWRGGRIKQEEKGPRKNPNRTQNKNAHSH